MNLRKRKGIRMNREPSEIQQQIITNKHDKLVVMSAAASGKALPNGSVVQTPEGPIEIQKLQVGQDVFGDDGGIYQVTGVFPQGERSAYRILFNDGSSCTCCPYHLWTYTDVATNKQYTKTLRDISNDYPILRGGKRLDALYKEKLLYIPMTKAVEYPEQDVPIEPYTYGLLLGSMKYSFNELPLQILVDRLQVANYLTENLGETLTLRRIVPSGSGKDGNRWTVVRMGSQLFAPNGIRVDQLLSRPGINKKYIYNSKSVRRRVLTGIIDAMGESNKSQYSMIVESGQLAEDIATVANSLGLYTQKCRLKTDNSRGVDINITRVITIEVTKDDPPLHRTAYIHHDWLPSKRRSHRHIAKIEYLNTSLPMTCISVNSPNRLFLTNHYIVTHNTFTLIERIRYLLKEGIDPTKLVAITFTNNAADEIIERLGDDYREGMYVGTIHGYANQNLVRHGYSTSHLARKKDFDKLFEMAMMHPEVIPEVDHLLLDEAQDSNYEQYDFIMNTVQPKEFTIFGDPDQCQPGWTQVEMADGQMKSIEDVKVGDRVKSYDITNNAIIAEPQSKVGIVLKTKNRRLKDGKILCIKTETGKESIYTHNHRTLIRFKMTDHNIFNYIAQKKNDTFIYGTATLNDLEAINDRFPKFWVLNTFTSIKDAKEALPTIGRDNFNVGEVVLELEKHNKDIRFPINANETWQNFNFGKTHVIAACNILPSCMQVLEKNELSEVVPTDIIGLMWGENPELLVYSLQISPHETYVADGIVTHNSIYGFNGGNPKLMTGLSNDYAVETIHMTENYRNGQKIIDNARDILKRMKHPVNDGNMECMRGINGMVDYVRYSQITDLITPPYKDWAILCRSNRKADEVIYRLMSKRIPFITFKQGNNSNKELQERIDSDAVKVLTIHSAKGLQFPNVIVAETSWNSEEDLRVMYVAATRAENQLYWTRGR